MKFHAKTTEKKSCMNSLDLHWKMSGRISVGFTEGTHKEILGENSGSIPRDTIQ